MHFKITIFYAQPNAVRCQMGKKCLYFILPHFSRMPHVMVENIPFYP